MNNLTFFSKGFFLTNRSLEIYLIGIALSLIGVLVNLFKGSPIGTVLQIVSLVSIFFTFGFQMSVPLLLTLKQQTKYLDFNKAWSVILRNTKRMILPVILFGTLFMVLFFSLLIWFVAMSHPTDSQAIVSTIKNFAEQMRNWNPIFIVLGIPFALFAFTPIYFSVENKGFFASMKRSISFSFKHLNFIMLLVLFGAVNYTVITPIRIPIENPLGQLALSVVIHYVGLIMSSSTLLFYQSSHNS